MSKFQQEVGLKLWWVVFLWVWFAPVLVLAQEAKMSSQQIVALAQQYCGACHTTPSPDLLPKASWPGVIDSMAELAERRFGKPFIPAEAIHHIKALYFGQRAGSLTGFTLY